MWSTLWNIAPSLRPFITGHCGKFFVSLAASLRQCVHVAWLWIVRVPPFMVCCMSWENWSNSCWHGISPMTRFMRLYKLLFASISKELYWVLRQCAIFRILIQLVSPILLYSNCVASRQIPYDTVNECPNSTVRRACRTRGGVTNLNVSAHVEGWCRQYSVKASLRSWDS